MSFGRGPDAGDIDVDRTPASGAVQVAYLAQSLVVISVRKTFAWPGFPAHPRRMRDMRDRAAALQGTWIA
jgi:hypothetical protein